MSRASTFSRSLAEAKKNARDLYRNILRSLPIIKSRYHLSIPLSDARRRIRADFDKHKHVKDSKLIDMLVLTGRVDLEESLNMWKTESHILDSLKPYGFLFSIFFFFGDERFENWNIWLEQQYDAAKNPFAEFSSKPLLQKKPALEPYLSMEDDPFPPGKFFVHLFEMRTKFGFNIDFFLEVLSEEMKEFLFQPTKRENLFKKYGITNLEKEPREWIDLCVVFGLGLILDAAYFSQQKNSMFFGFGMQLVF